MYHKVYSPCLDSNKPWYALTSSICGVNPARFVKQSIYQVYKDEIKCVQLSSLTGKDGGQVPREVFGLDKQPFLSEVHVATPFGLYVGLLRQKNLNLPQVFNTIEAVINNNIELDNFGAKTINAAKVTNVKAENQADLISGLKAQLNKASDEIKSLRNQLKSIQELIDSSAVEEPPNKKQKCSTKSNLPNHKQVYHSLKYVAAKHQTSISSVLGDMIAINDSDAADILSELVDKIVELKGSKRAFDEILSDHALQSFLAGLRVPDWALLYFKLSSMIADDAWQTMLNITHLGRSGVSEILIPININNNNDNNNNDDDDDDDDDDGGGGGGGDGNNNENVT